VSENSALRASGFFTRQSGFAENVFTDEELGLFEFGGRLKYLWQPDDDWQIYLGADYAHEHGPAGAVVTRRSDAPGGFVQTQDTAAGIQASPQNVTIASNGPTTNRFDVGGAQATVVHSLGNDLTLTDITAARYYSDRSDIDTDQLPLSLADINHQGRDYWQLSEELRLASSAERRFEYQVGLYYLYLRAKYFFTQKFDLQPLRAPPPPGRVTLATSQYQLARNASYAAFAEGTYSIVDTLRLIAGGRYTYDDVDYTNTRSNPGGLIPRPLGAVTGATVVDNFSFRVGLQYDVSADVLSYLTYSRGYKGPAFDQLTATEVRPEIPKNIELGIKSTLLDRRLTLNLALFHEDFDGYQAQVRRPGETAGFVVLNAGSVRSQGAEVEFRAIAAHGLTLSGGATYNHTEYRAFLGVPCYTGQPIGNSGTNVCLPDGTTNVSGNQLSVAPKWSSTLAASYEHPIAARLNGLVQADYNYRSSFNFTPTKDPATQLGGVGILGGAVGIEADDGHWRLFLYGRNLLDKRVPTWLIADPLSGIYGDVPRGGNSWQQFDQSSFRTVGVSFDLQY
jgi:iron complex outermembrane receptor protein